MAEEKIIIRFDAQGDKGLRTAIRKLDNDMRELQGKQKKYNEESLLGTRNNRLQSNSFATLRSKILLVNFAMAMGVRQMIQFTKQAASLQDVNRAFNTLQGGADKGALSINKLKKATDGTVSEFDLFQQANNAMILGITKNSSEMAEMFDIAQRLGQALGKDTRSSVESLITGIGRQSRLMLDNIGIIVKSDEAYEDYAEKLGISAEKLTDAQKKTAFLEATMESAREKVASLGDEQLSNSQKMEKMRVAVIEASNALGEALMPVVIPLAKGLELLARGAEAVFDAFSGANIKVQFEALVEELAFLQSAEKNLLDRLERVGDFKPPMIAGMADEFVLKTGSMNSNVLAMLENLEMLRNQIKQVKETIESELDGVVKKTGLAKALEDINKLFDEQIKKAKESSEAISQSAAKQGMSYKNAGLAAQEAATQVIQAEMVKAIGSAMSDAFAKFGIAGVVLAAGASAAVGSLFGGAVTEAKKLKFEQGGLIGGRRHSQGGTIIEAEQGEFIMNRSAVQSVGIENLNRMNQGGAGASVVVNVSGNVMSQDYVEGELAEQIKEAIRRGNDFGVS